MSLLPRCGVAMKTTRRTSWQRLDEECLAEEVAILGLAHELFERPVAHFVPQPRSTLDDHHLGQQSAHAMADQNHPVER